MLNRLLLLLSCMAVTCIFLPSCAVTYGNKAVASARSYEGLQAGKATKTDVYNALGQPSHVVDMREGDCVLWTHRYREAKNNFIGYIPVFGIGLIAGGKNGDVYTVIIKFDRNGVLMSRSANRKKLYTSNLASLKRTLDSIVEWDLSQSRVKDEMKKIGKPFDAKIAKESQLLEAAMD